VKYCTWHYGSRCASWLKTRLLSPTLHCSTVYTFIFDWIIITLFSFSLFFYLEIPNRITFTTLKLIIFKVLFKSVTNPAKLILHPCDTGQGRHGNRSGFQSLDKAVGFYGMSKKLQSDPVMNHKCIIRTQVEMSIKLVTFITFLRCYTSRTTEINRICSNGPTNTGSNFALLINIKVPGWLLFCFWKVYPTLHHTGTLLARCDRIRIAVACIGYLARTLKRDGKRTGGKKNSSVHLK
jgi:hypothetical protein